MITIINTTPDCVVYHKIEDEGVGDAHTLSRDEVRRLAESMGFKVSDEQSRLKTLTEPMRKFENNLRHIA